ncbi:MAG: hypothetical protein ACFFCE_02695 [Promethearchaeota archaeon]
MDEKEMNEQIVKIISEAIEQTSHSSCIHSDSHCIEEKPDSESKSIQCGTNKCKGLHSEN